MRNLALGIVICLAFIGCSQNNPRDPQTVAKESWKQFLAKVKSNVPGAESTSSISKEGFNLEISVGADDLKNSTSVKYPFEGTVVINSVHAYSTLRSNFRHTMKFGFEDGRWVFLGGHEENPHESFDITMSRWKYLAELFRQ